MLSRLQNIDSETITAVLRSGGSVACGLPQETVDYLLQINRASELMKSKEAGCSMLEIARQLQTEYPQISLRTARRRVSDCVSYLHSESENTQEEWHELYADRMDSLGYQCEQNGNLDGARKCYEKAHEYRVLAASGRVNPEKIQFRRAIVSPDLQAARMGLGDDDLREVWRSARQMISQTTLSERDKQRLRDDLEREIEDVEFE